MCQALPYAPLTTELKAVFLGVDAVGEDVSEGMHENAGLVGTAGNSLLKDNVWTGYSSFLPLFTCLMSQFPLSLPYHTPKDFFHAKWAISLQP